VLVVADKSSRRKRFSSALSSHNWSVLSTETINMFRTKWLVAAAAALLALVDPVHAVVTNITSLCSPHAMPPSLIKGETTYVCVNVNDKYRTVFTPVADQFTVLRISDCECHISPVPKDDRVF
jgi:hypothetical protein